MTKICPNCGLPYKGYAYKCVECRAILKKKKLKPWQIAVIVISVVLTVALLSGTVAYLVYDHIHSPETRVEEVMGYFMEGDLDSIMNSIPAFLWEYEQTDRHKLTLEMSVNVKVAYDYLYSFNVNQRLDPSDRQIDELIDSIKSIAGEDFDASVIQDVKMIWVDIRGGLTNFWQTTHSRFTMIKYQDEWCWWPYY